MSVKKKKAGLVISWQKSFSILAPWRRGKGDRDALLDSDVVLTKIKLLSTIHERLLMANDSTSTISTVSVSEHDTSDSTKAPEVNFHPDDKSDKPRMESDSDYLSAIFLDSQLPRLYKFESEDSGVELPSGANSPSTPTGSEHSFIVHSRESSCNSCNLNSDSSAVPDKLVKYAQSSMEVHIDEDMDWDLYRAKGTSPEGDDEMSGQFMENSAAAEDMQPGKQSLTGACNEMNGNEPEPEPMRRSATSDSLEEYMDECCRLSKAQPPSSNPLGSGLGYLEHICHLIEKIGQLQETNFRLQKQICSFQKDGRMTKTKEEFFQQHCSCGGASLAFQDVQKTHSRSDCLTPSGTLSDLSTIHEVTQCPLISTRRDMSSEGLTSVPLWRRGLNRRSYTEGEVRFLGDSTEGLSIPQRRLSENYTWGRVKDLVRKNKLRNQGRLGLTSTSLKMSCPQLYMFSGSHMRMSRTKIKK